MRIWFLAPCQHFRAIVCVFENNGAYLRSEKTPVARVAHVLLLRPISGNVEVNTLASMRSELIGNAAIVRKRRVSQKSTCVCLRLPVAAIYADTQERKTTCGRLNMITFRNVATDLANLLTILLHSVLSNTFWCRSENPKGHFSHPLQPSIVLLII